MRDFHLRQQEKGMAANVPPVSANLRQGGSPTTEKLLDDVASISLKSSKFNGLYNPTTLSAQSMILTDQLKDRLTLDAKAQGVRTPKRKTIDASF